MTHYPCGTSVAMECHFEVYILILLDAPPRQLDELSHHSGASKLEANDEIIDAHPQKDQHACLKLYTRLSKVGPGLV